MKTIALNARIMQRLWQRKTLVHRRHAAVKGRIKTSHLRHTREGCARCIHTGQVVRLVQRRQRRQCGDAGEHGITDKRGAIKSHAAVHDAVAHCRYFGAADLGQHLPKCLFMGERLWPVAQAFDLASKLRFCQITINRKQRKFDR